MSDPWKTASTALYCVIASYAFGFLAVFTSSTEMLGLGVIVTAVLNLTAFIMGGRVRKELDVESRAKSRAALVQWLAAIGLAGTVVLMIATVGSTLAIR